MEVEELYKALQLVTDTVNQDEIILDVDDFDERTICRVGREEGGEDLTVHKTMD